MKEAPWNNVIPSQGAGITEGSGNKNQHTGTTMVRICTVDMVPGCIAPGGAKAPSGLSHHCNLDLLLKKPTFKLIQSVVG